MTSHSNDQEVERIRNLLNEDIPEENENNIGHDTDSEYSYTLEHEEHNSGTETNDSNSSKESNDIDSDSSSTGNRQYFWGKDKITKWAKTVPTRNSTRVREQNIIRVPAGVKGEAKNCKSPTDCFSLFIDNNIIKSIVFCTNLYIDRIAPKFTRSRDVNKTDENEIKCLIGLLYLAGVNRSGHQNLEDLWRTNGLGIDIFHATMTMKRFFFLLRCIRFDDYRDRQSRKEIDNFAAFREIFELFLANCENNYTLSEYTTIDEQLVAFRGRCPFRVYIPSKPAKYGLKIQTICDSQTWYTLNMELYTGKQRDGPYKISNSATDVVLRLSKPIYDSGRNITADNWFSSITLANELLEKKITLVSTLRKNKRELPIQFVSTKNRAENSTLFGFAKKMTIASYIPKKNKNVIMLSTMHLDGTISELPEDNSKPEIILFYNKTKTGVDTVDEMCATYSVSRKVRRWPLVLFFRLIDIAGINAQVIFSTNNQNNRLIRRKFLEDIGLSLLQVQLKKRVISNYLPRSLRQKAFTFSEEEKLPEISPVLGKRGRCAICPRNKDIKTKTSCQKCKTFMCLKHMETVCNDCFEKNECSTDSE